jgi:hypothetical protein
MYRRICPEEEVLSAYLCDRLPAEEKENVEAHLACCPPCRDLIACALKFGMAPGIGERGRAFFALLKKNLWLLGAAFSLGLSFFCPRHFMQFLAAGVIMGLKWIVDGTSFRMMFLVQERLKKDAEKKPAGLPAGEKSRQNNR